MLRRIADRLSQEHGIALIFAVIFMAVLAAGVTTVVYVSSSSQYSATRSKSSQDAYHLAQAGIASAMATLHGTESDGSTPINALDDHALCDTSSDTLPCWHQDDYSNGYVRWSGTLDTTTQQWTITSTGHVDHAAGPTSPPVERTLTGVSQVVASLTQPVNNEIWNYIYSFSPNLGTCNVSVATSNNSAVAAPLFVEGNLCISQNGKIEGTGDASTPVDVVVLGGVQYSKASVGTSQNPVNEAHLAGGCGSSLSNLHTCTVSGDKIYAGTFDTTPPDLHVDQPDYDTYYADANPGPNHPCDSATAVNPPAFDTGDGTRNDSLPTFNVTGGTSYTCKGFDAFGNQVGELSWNASTGELTVSGVVYFDGNIEFDPSSGVAEYSGMGTIYSSGYVTLHGNVCGVESGGSCDWTTAGGGSWDPNSRMLIVVAAGQDASGDSVIFADSNGNDFQGGFFAQDSVKFQNNANVEGPMIGGDITFNNNVKAKPFPKITTVPRGAPDNPNVYADAKAPQVTG